MAQGHTAQGGRSGLKLPAVPRRLRSGARNPSRPTLALRGLIARMGTRVCGQSGWDWVTPLQESPPPHCRLREAPGVGSGEGAQRQLPSRAHSGGGVWGGGTPPHPQQEVAGEGRRGPRLTRGALPHWPRAAPTAGRRTRGRAGAGLDTPPPAGALHLAAAGERLPCPCPALRWPLRLPPPPPPLGRGGRAQAASDPSCRSSLLFFPLPVWHGHH